MKPTTKIYTFVMGKNGNLADAFRLKVHSEMSDRVCPCDFGNNDERGLMLPWMKKDELAAWFRKAADLIEKTKLE